jgi:hypothetical protein
MQKILSIITIVFFVSIVSCKKSVPVDNQQTSTPVPMQLITAPGIADGPAVSKAIGTNGGTISSADGKISINIPQGAISDNQTITVQPITNKLESGLGKAYRITPHIPHFNKPVTITFSYTQADIVGTAPEVFAIGYQNTAGGWLYKKNVQLNKVNKTISITTTHFSDWALFEKILLTPEEVRLKLDGNKIQKFTIMAAASFDLDPNDMVDPIISAPYELNSELVTGWTITNPAIGSFVKAGSNATFTAAKEGAGTVEATIALPNSGASQLKLIGQIIVLSDLYIDFMEVDETESSLISRSALFIYGNFGARNNSSIKINNIELNPNEIEWSPKFIICKNVPPTGPGSSGMVVITNNGKTITKLLQEWTVVLKYEKVESPGSELVKKMSIALRLRGDALGYGSGNVPPINPTTDLNSGSDAHININTGVVQNHTTSEGCATYKVQWDAVNNHIVPRKLYGASNDGLRGRVTRTAAGFQVKLYVQSSPVLKTTRTTLPCQGASSTRVVYEPLTITPYEDDELEFTFSSLTTSSPSIQAHICPTLTGTGLASGLYYDAANKPPASMMTTKLYWTAALPKW